MPRFTFLHGLIMALIFMIVLMGLSFYTLLLREALTECRLNRASLEKASALAGHRTGVLQRELEDLVVALKEERRKTAVLGQPGADVLKKTLTASGVVER